MENPQSLCPRSLDVEDRTRELGEHLFEAIERTSPSLLDPKRYSGQLMEWAMADDTFRTALFRFVDVLPSLEPSASVIRIAQEYFLPAADRFPGLLRWGLKMDPDSLQAKAAALFIRKQIASMGQQFIVGENPQTALPSLHRIRKAGRAFTVDLLGEACLSETEAVMYKDRYLELIRELSKASFTHGKPDHPGDNSPINISVKLSALSSHLKPVMTDEAVLLLAPALREIFRAARNANGFVYLDMEDHAKREMILKSLTTVLMEPEFRDWDQVGVVLQAYLRQAPDDLRHLHAWVRERGTKVAVRLVKGAYWDTETIQSRLNRWPTPVWQEKVSSDICFESLAQYLLENTDCFYPAFASHNLRSLAFAIAVSEKKGLASSAFEVQALYGMAEPIKDAITSKGHLVREYAPVGELLPGMAYLVRRLLENTSNKGFIRQRFREGESAASLLKRPEIDSVAHSKAYTSTCYQNLFVNSPLVDFSDITQREPLLEAVSAKGLALLNGTPTIYPIVGGREIRNTSTHFDALSPSDAKKVVARVSCLPEAEVEPTLEGLRQAFHKWKQVSQEERSSLMEKVASSIEADRQEMVASIVHECGKPIPEADADVAEGIDFLRYYAERARSLAKRQELCGQDGETDVLIYEPRGVAAVIAPWNFAMAIPCGMLAAALVTGNTAVLKPAEQSSFVAERLFRHFLTAGLPPDVAAFAPGLGETVGRKLVESTQTDTILFTGSKNVGLSILKTASTWRPGQRHIKRVIIEMGGKNAIIVDESADLDQAIKGVLESAFGFAGQKCSACSRVFVHQSIYRRFKERLIPAVSSLVCGPAELPESDLGPVVDGEAFKRLCRLREKMGEPDAEGALHPRCTQQGYYIPATLYADVNPQEPFMQEEWFGPILGLARAESFDHAIRLTNQTQYGLTAAVYSRSPRNLQMAAVELEVGNLYLNRNCTGALVGRQPFGGARLSGVGSKAGGPDYLLQLVHSKVVSENTLRQGFAPIHR